MTSLMTSFLILLNLAPYFGWIEKDQAKTGIYVKVILIIFLLVKTELIYLHYNSSKFDLNKTYILWGFYDVIKKLLTLAKNFLHQNVSNIKFIVCTKFHDFSLVLSKVIRHGPTRPPPQYWQTQKSPVKIGLNKVSIERLFKELSNSVKVIILAFIHIFKNYFNPTIVWGGSIWSPL